MTDNLEVICLIRDAILEEQARVAAQTCSTCRYWKAGHTKDRVCARLWTGRGVSGANVRIRIVADSLPFMEDDNSPVTPADFGCRLWKEAAHD